MFRNCKEAAKELGISAYELRTGAIAGRYPFILCGNKRLFDAEQIRSILHEQAVATQEEARKCLMG